ncbi:MAG TPA: hypothetical protein VHZ03_10215, partial [Trebonia sp.]|nr:hypothetical protein [Trebonia sp.]
MKWLPSANWTGRRLPVRPAAAGRDAGILVLRHEVMARHQDSVRDAGDARLFRAVRDVERVLTGAQQPQD